jgi:hypothetical protein
MYIIAISLRRGRPHFWRCITHNAHMRFEEKFLQFSMNCVFIVEWMFHECIWFKSLEPQSLCPVQVTNKG